MPDAIKQKRADIETPALLVDLDVMERNLETMARFFCNRPAKLRPPADAPPEPPAPRSPVSPVAPVVPQPASPAAPGLVERS